MNDEKGTLAAGEFHPASSIALKFIDDEINNLYRRGMILESLSSAALSGNRVAEVVYETLRRIINDELVSDRYLMGAAWMLWEMKNHKYFEENE